MYEQLNNSTRYKTELRSQGKSDSEIQSEIEFRAKNYAIRKTSLLHFDYADVAKASWLLHPAGRLLGQFQHFGIKFWEYNTNLVREGKDDIMAGEVLGDRAKKAYSMGLAYFLVPAIASAVTGLDFGNVIEHDSKEKINKLWTLFTGSDDEIKKAFYGRGIVTGLPFIGAPVVSDALALGHIWEFYNFDDSTLQALLSGYENYGLKSGDQKTYETMRLLNVALSRQYYKTLPMVTSGKLGSAAQYELGMYPTKESKDLKESMSNALPEDIRKALEAIESSRKAGISKGIASTDQSKGKRSRNILTEKNIFQR